MFNHLNTVVFMKKFDVLAILLSLVLLFVCGISYYMQENATKRTLTDSDGNELIIIRECSRGVRGMTLCTFYALIDPITRIVYVKDKNGVRQLRDSAGNPLVYEGDLENFRMPGQRR